MDKSIKILSYLSLAFVIFKIIAVYYSELGLHGDEAQYWVWSNELAGGYFSKPPLLPLFIKIFSLFFGNSIFGIKLLSLSVYLITSTIVYLIGKKLFNNKVGFVCGVSFFLLPGVSFSSFITSTDVLLLLFWSLSLYILILLKEDPSLSKAFFLGFFVGLGFMSKYAMIYFIICTIVYVFLNKEFFNKILNSKKLYLFSIFVCLVTISPNIFWNISNSWVTFGHTFDNAAIGVNLKFNFEKFLLFIIAQIFILGPLFFLVSIYSYKNIFTFSEQNTFLISYSFPVIIIILIESIISRAHGNWAAPFYIGFLILLVGNVYVLRHNFILFGNILNLLIGFVFFYLVLSGTSYKSFSQLQGHQIFSEAISKYMKDEKIKNLVVQDRMHYALLKYYLRDFNFIMYISRSQDGGVNNHFQINNSLPINFKDNFLYIGNLNELNYLEENYEIKLFETKSINFKFKDVKIYKYNNN